METQKIQNYPEKISLKFNGAGRFLLLIAVLGFLFLAFGQTSAATLKLGPTTGSFETGSTFSLSVFLNTEDEPVNALEVSLLFPPDKLQVVSPLTGTSIIEIWTAPPKFDNRNGILSLQGGIPSGINVSKGLVSIVTFRVKGTGIASVRFGDSSKVLAHDGKGTNILSETQGGTYNLILPPPQGPIISSETHPDSDQWYSISSIIFTWAPPGRDVTGYSYVLNKEPVDLPDNVSEGAKTSVVYHNIDDGVYYFHIKALRGEIWGGVSHSAVNIDTEPPAKFTIDVSPASRTDNKNPIISFRTTDKFSGLDHYEMKVIPLSPEDDYEPFFIETETTEVLNLDLGKYDVIVRAYDRVGNFQESVVRLAILSPLNLLIENILFWTVLTVLVLLAAFAAWRIRRWHRNLLIARGRLPDGVRAKLEELNHYRKKYGKLTMLLLLAFSLTVFWTIPGGHLGAQSLKISPPIITALSENISNEDIFYIGGKTDQANIKIIVYLQNLETGEAMTETVLSDRRGDWFYRHSTFLPSGNFILWVQSQIGEELSPPTPQVAMTVRKTAVQFGASRLSFEVIYLGLAVVLFAAFLGLLAFTLYHGYAGRKKYTALRKEIREAEESVKLGFAVLRRDIYHELETAKKARPGKELSREERERQDNLLRDLAKVEQYIGKEIRDVGEVGRELE